MPYARCPTCGCLLAHVHIPFAKGKEDIKNSEKLKTKKQKEDALTELLQKLVNNDCCNIALTQCVDDVVAIHANIS